MPDFSAESGFLPHVVGIDEAGRGSWAGPVVAAAVWLDAAHPWPGLNDSKQLSAHKREAAFAMLSQSPHAIIGIGEASAEEIDCINILQATFLAMQRAVDAWQCAAGAHVISHALIDGNRTPKGWTIPTIALVKGDSRSLSIAAASIIAKVTRDRTMCALHEQHPHYGWNSNAGYGTATHQHGLKRHGITTHHRKSYAPIRVLLAQEHAA
jgi:ribonuclease HII